MSLVQYTAEVRDNLMLALPAEAERLHLRPGDKVDIHLDFPGSTDQSDDEDALWEKMAIEARAGGMATERDIARLNRRYNEEQSAE